MKLSFSSKYILDRDFEIIKNNDNVLCIDYNNVNWFRTNDTGYKILQLCAGKLTLEEVIKKISIETGFECDFLKKNFEEFLENAIESGLIIEKEKNKVIIEEVPSGYSDIWIHVTDKCNLKCPFCYSNSGSFGEQKLDLENILNFLVQIPLEQRSSVLISGGEPFLYENLSELVKSLHKMEFQDITVISNGTVGEEVYREVIPYIHTLQISVDGTNSDIHDLSRGEGSFHKMIKKFELAKNLDVNRLVISFTPTKFNIMDLPNIPKFALENRIDAIHITRLLPVGRGAHNEESIAPTTSQLSESMTKFIENIKKVNTSIHYKREMDEFFVDETEKSNYINVTMGTDVSSKILFRHKRKGCSLGDGTISIGYDGFFYPCPALQYEEFRLGQLERCNFEDIVYQSRNTAKQYSVDNIEACTDCKMKYFCGGGCRAIARSSTGSMLGKDPLCNRYQESMYEIMWNAPKVTNT